MKKITMLSIIAAAVLFVGCGDDTKKAASEATTKAVETTKEAASKTEDAVKKAGDAISEATEKAVEATKKAAETTQAAASTAVETAEKSVKEVTDSAKEAISPSSDKAAGAAIFKKCAGCHGADGKTKALGKSAVIAGESKEDLVKKIHGYKAGTLDTAGMGSLMKGQVASLSDADIDAVADYISTMK